MHAKVFKKLKTNLLKQDLIPGWMVLDTVMHPVVGTYQGSGTEVWLTHHGRQFKVILCICNKL